MLPQEFLDKVKDKIRLVELISEYTALSKAGDKVWQGHCPHPEHDDSSPSFRIFEKGYKNGKRINKYDTWACMGCHCGNKTLNSKHKNYGSDCFAFYQWIHGVSWKQAVNELCKKYNIPLPQSKFDRLFKIKKMQSDSYIKNLTEGKAKQFLYNRGLSDIDIQKWQIGFDGKIVFPLLDRYKNILGFTKRWIEVPEGRNDKYKNSKTSEIFNKSSYFYGLHNIDSNFNEIRITEGPMDVIMADKYNGKNIVATLGTAFTDNHVEVIKNLGLVPVMIMDGDKPGIAAGEKSIEKLAEHGIYSKILILPQNEDLCDLSRSLEYEIEDYISSNAITYGQYKVRNIVNGYDSAINELKLKKIKDIKNILEDIPYEPERIIMKEYILKRMDIRMESFKI